jgi:ATP-dependent exoDNAse (exonuclease V) beta subunit
MMTPSKPRFANELIRASAGTGKTFQLSNRFIGLAAAGEPLDTILATTFTRKGAGEILDRVLSRLAGGSKSPKAAAELAEQLADPTLDRRRCIELLQELVAGLHRLRVGTLDSFFIQMARSFSLELGMPPGWRIVDEIADARLRTEAVRAVLEDESTAAAVRLMNLLFKGEASRSVAEEIAGLVSDLYGVFLEAPPEAWQALPRTKPLEPNTLAAAIDALAAVELPAGKSFAGAREQDLGNAESEAWQDFLAKGVAKKVLEGSDKFGRQQIPPEVAAVYEPLVRHAQAVLVGRIANQTEATGRLLARFGGDYERLKAQRQAMRFEDVTRRLADGRLDDRVEDLAYRLDARVAHLLLDEFQDTDPLQWRAIRPMARRAVAAPGRHSFFCVGDVKQAIFGWRGGVAEIFEALTDELKPLSTRPLNQSYRSSQPVIDTVNRVFENLGANAALRNSADARDRWAIRFEHHTTAKTELSGYCRLAVAPEAPEGQAQRDVTLRYAAAEIAGLHRHRPEATIGALVRTNASLARLIYELRLLGVEASEEGGNPLTDSPAVQVVLALLTLADHPGDLTARFLVANSPLADEAGLTSHDDASAAVRLAREIRRRLMDEGYGPTILGWVESLSGRCDARDRSRLGQLVELVYGYEASATCRTDDFIRVVCETRVEDPSGAAIRVMTLHKAKGLQFDVVVLPELDANLTGRTPRLVVGRPHPTAPVDHVCRYVSKTEQAMLPRRFQATFAADETRRAEESLCVLYVGLTRPVHALHMVVPPSRPSEKNIPSTLAGVLRAALTDGSPAAAESILYEHGDPEWQVGRPSRPTAEVPQRPTPAPSGRDARPALEIKLAAPSTRPSRGLDFRSPSQMEGGPRVSLASRLRLEAAGAMDRGTLLHAWFEQIEWLEDGLPDDQTLLAIADRLEIGRLDAPSLVRRFHEMLRQPAISSLLRRPGEADWEVRREYPFVVRDGDALLRGAIDRLVLRKDAGRTVAADVIDFKTDNVSAAQPDVLAARVEQYRPQLDAYHRATARLLGLNPEQVTARLAFVEPGLIRTICPADVK